MRRLLISIPFLLSVSPLQAQTLGIEPGILLRVHMHGAKLEGHFVRWEADTLVLWGKGFGSKVLKDNAIAVSNVEGLEYGVPRSAWGGAWRGALWGVLVGSVLGAVIGRGADLDCFLCPSSRGEAIAGGLIVLGGLGAGAGALVGAAFSGTRWEAAPLERPDEATSR